MNGFCAPAVYVVAAVAVGTTLGVPLVMVEMMALTLAGSVPLKSENAPVA